MAKLSILNDPPKVLEGPQLLHDLIPWEIHAKSCALDFTKHEKRQKYTYQELQSCSNSLVAKIGRSLARSTTKSDTNPRQHIVPLLIPQSPGLYISQLAILKSGGAFCPLNLDSPIERLKFNVQDVKATFVITTSEFEASFAWEDGPEVIVVDEFPPIESEDAELPKTVRRVTPHELAYVMYTSGSSGTPKGVAVSHLAASQSLLAHERFLPQFERFLQFAAPSFDVSVFEIFFPLKRGRTLVGCEKTQLMNDLAGVITKLEIDAAELTPGVAGSLLEKRSNAPGLKLLLTIGEMLTHPVVEEFGGSETQENMLYGMYGPTEAAIHCTVFPKMEANAKPGNIGVPFETVSTFIASPATSVEEASKVKLLPVGDLGELLLGGPQLAQGYLNREEQNKLAFVNFEGKNYYRTGDKARQLGNGTIEILGRISSGQVKLRGQRLELGEVEDAVYKHPGVKTATAAIVKKCLVAYVLVRNENVKASEVVETCSKWLPKYMIPSEIVILQNFPYLPSGKIDKRKLDSNYLERQKNEDAEAVDFLTKTERAVKDVLEECLSEFRSTMRLAAAGVDSLMAIRVATKLRSINFNISTISVLKADNLQALARICDDSLSSPIHPRPKHREISSDALLPVLNGNAKNVEYTMSCTPLQSAMLSETTINQRAYRNWIELELSNTTDVDHVISALESLANFNPILRTGFMESSEVDGYVQIVWRDLSGYEIRTTEEFDYGFDDSLDVSLRHPLHVQIMPLETTTKLLIHIHHALYDAWSLELLLDDLDALLAGRNLTERPAYRDVVDGYRDGILAVDDWSTKDYWKDHLENVELRKMPCFHAGKVPQPALRVAKLRTSIPTSSVEAMARDLAISPQSIFQAGYAMILGSYLGSSELCFGTVFSGRTLPIPGVEDITGPCLNTLPIRIDTSMSASLQQLAQDINVINRKHLEHSALPLRNIKSVASISPGQQLFDTLVIWQQTLHTHDYSRQNVLLVDTVDNLEFTLTLEIIPTSGNIELKANYQQAMFPKKQIDLLLRQLEELTKLAMEEPAILPRDCFRNIADSLLSMENEKPQMSPNPASLSSSVEKVAKEDPHRPAIEFAKSIIGETAHMERMTYSELNIRSNQIGSCLLERNVLPDELVCICMEKSIDLYASILAVTKIGAGYLPQTPEVPLERLQNMLQESKVKVVLAESSSRALLQSFTSLIVVYVDEFDFTCFSADDISSRGSPEHVSYCVYTSGSTGTPKGVLVTQGNLLSNLDVLEHMYPASKNARLLQQCSQGFDVSVFEIFFTWRVGGCICSAVKNVLFRDLENAIRVLRVTHLSMTPSVAALVDPQNVPSVQFLVTAGEAVTQKVFNSWADHGLWQGYGPSETTNICTVKPKVSLDDGINNIGPPLSNTSAFVVAAGNDFQIIPLGGEGEFVFGGAQVFRGYVDTTKNADKVIEHSKYGKLYRTGDFGRMLTDGSLVFTGRKDDQIKIRGQRIELGEINNVMLRSAAVRDCVTMVVGSKDDSSQQLVCFWAVGTGASDSFDIVLPEQSVLTDLYKSLESALPPYMIPSALIPVSFLPSTTQGKVDRRRLTELFRGLDINHLGLTSQVRDTSSEHLWSELEKAIAKAVASVAKVHVHYVRAETSFFNLGIDSISAISLARYLRQSTSREVEISDVLKYPSVLRLAQRLSSQESEPERPIELPDPPSFGFEDDFRQEIIARFKNAGKTVQAIYPCTPLQEAMLSAGESSSSLQHYDTQVTLDIIGDVKNLQDCWQKMVWRHEILRTCFVSTDLPQYPFVQIVLDSHRLTFDGFEDKSSEGNDFEPLYTLNLIEINGIQKLTISMNHALYDGVALAVLYDEVEMLYNKVALPSPVSFEPFLKRMQLMNKDTSDRFWESRLKNLNGTKFQNRETLNDGQRSTRIQALTASYPLSWVETNVRSHSTSLLAVCHTVWACLLAEQHYIDDICFGNVVSGRAVPIDGIERLVAPCFNTIPVRLQNISQLSNLEAFRKFQTFNADSLPYQMTPLRRLQSKFSPDGSRLFDTLFILQQSSKPLDSKIWSLSDDRGIMDFPLVCEVVPKHSDDTLEIILHSYTSILSDESALKILTAIQDKIQYALQNPRHPLLSANTKEEIATKSESRRSARSEKANVQMSDEKLSERELDLRDVIARFTDVPAENVGRDVSIFRLGLDSISTVQVAAQLRKQGKNVKASDILANSTIAKLCDFLDGNIETSSSVAAFDFVSFDKGRRQDICLRNQINIERVEAVRPCTYVQQGMIATTLHSNNNAYMNSMWLDLPIDVSLPKLKSAWEAACSNNDMLRTGFASTDDSKDPFVMITYSIAGFQMPWYEDSNVSDIVVSSDNLLRQPWALYLSKQGDKNAIQFTAHHALYDAQSIQMILSDVASSYTSETLPDRPSVNPLLSAILSNAQDEHGEKQAFWQMPENKIVINRFPDLTPLRVYEPTTAVREIISRASISELEAVCRANGVTIQAASQAAWARLLTAYIGETSTTFGMTLSGRSIHEDADKISFPTIVTLPVRCDVSGTNAELLLRTMNTNAALHEHQFTPLTSIQKWAGYPEGKIFDTLFAYQKLPDGDDDITMPWNVSKEEAFVDYAVSMEVQPSNSREITLRLTFREDLIPTEQAEILLRQYDALLLDTLQNPGALSDITYHLGTELVSITPALEDILPGPVNLLHEFVELQARQRPDKIAFEFATNLSPDNFQSRKWTYRQLNEESNQVANLLVQRGVKPGEIIAICFDKCPEASFAIIGIMKAGCAYVALDPTAPSERSKFIVMDSSADLILSAGSPAATLRTYMEKEILVLDSPAFFDDYSSEPPNISRKLTPEDTSYCLYTSGTTGTPKGCLITHDNAVQFMLAFSKLFDGYWNDESKYLQFASFHFDVSVMEQFWSWSIGICVASAPRDLIFEDLAQAIRTLGITNIDLTPSLARTIHPDDVPTLCKGAFITGGEQLKQEILDEWGQYETIYNGYGPTEVTIGCTMYPRVPKNGQPANIGPAYVNVGSFVMKSGTELPVLRGGIGELCVSGKLVGKGYLNRDDLTAERFPTLKEFGERVYRTGDLVRILHDGSFVFLGRADDQVKLRGQRLELSEINQVIKKSINGIQDVVTLVLKHSAQQKEQLVTFFVLANSLVGDDGSTISILKDACKAKLPGYMVPTHFIPVKAIPLNANNKADSKQLGAMYNELEVDYLQKLSQPSREDKDWQNNEKPIVKIVSKAMAVDESSLTRSSNIFELGLDSISVIGFSRALQSAGLDNAKLSVVKANPSIGDLVRALIEDNGIDQSQDNAVIAASQYMAAFSQKHIVGVCKDLGIESSEVEHLAPCTPAQEGMIYRFLDSDQALYFNIFELKLNDHVDISKFMAAWDRVVSHLEILRTKFVNTDDGFAQVVLRQAAQNTAIDYETAEKYAALRSPYRISVDGHTLTLRIFHGLYDGNSLTMLLQRVVDEYKEYESIDYGPSFISTLSSGPLAKPSGAKDFWESHLQGWTYSPMSITAESTDDVVVTGTIDGMEQFESLRKKLGVTPQALIQAAWIAVLQNVASSSLTIGIVTSGRAIDFEGADKVIGPLFNTVPFHAKITSGTTSAALVTQCHEYNMKMQDFQHTPLKDIQKWVPSKPGQALFDTLFVFQRPGIEDEDFANEVWTIVDNDHIADYPLAFEANLSPDNSKLSLVIVAQGSAMNQSQASELLGQFESALRQMLDTAGQNVVPGGSPRTENETEHTATIEPVTSEASKGPFTWTNDAVKFKEEIVKLAGIDETSINEHSSIFELGLDSIDVIKLVSRLKRRGVEIPVSFIIKSQTIAKMIVGITPKNSDSKPPTRPSLLNMRRSLETYLESIGKLPRNVEAVLPATPLQQSMVKEMISSNYERYFNVDGFKLQDSVGLKKLIKAVKQVVEKSPVLRTTFIEIDDPKSAVSYAQIVHQILPQFDKIDEIENLPQDRTLKNFIDHFRHIAVSLATNAQQLLQIRAVSAGETDYLVIAISHALYDGTSLRSFHEDISRAYEGNLLDRPNLMPHLEQVFQSTTDDAKNFWRTTVSDLPPAKFPTREALPNADQDLSTRLERRSRVSLQAIEEMCKSSRISIQTLGQTCWALVLSQLMGQLDVVFGSVLSCRDSEEAAEVMFPLMNTVAVRSVLHGSLNEMLAYMQEISDTTRQYQHFPLGTAQAYALASKQDRERAGDTTLFDTLFIYQGRRSTTGDERLYESVYGVSDVEFPVCVEMEIVDDEYLSWTTKCKATARTAAETEEVLDALETVLERLVTAPQEQTIVSDADGVSVCGLPKFQVKTIQQKKPLPSATGMSDEWSDVEMKIRKALQHISDVPEESIQKDTTIFHLGLDSILVLKLPALLKTYGIKLSVSMILKEQTVYAMANAAQSPIVESEQAFNPDAEISSALKKLDFKDDSAKLEPDIWEVQNIMPATAGQIYMIRQWQVSRGAMFYQTFTYSFSGPIQKEKLDAAWSQLLSRHDILRTGFVEAGEAIIQVVFKDPKNDVIYCSGAESVITRKSSPDLRQPPANLVVEQAEGKEVTLELVLHHALYDGISLPILIDELQTLYHGRQLEPSTLDFKPFVARTIAASPTAKEKWIAYINGQETLYSSGNTSNYLQRTEVFRSPMPVSNIKSLAQSTGVSVDALLLAAIAKIHTSNFQPRNELKSIIPHVIFGVYLANRAPFGEDLSLLAAPTLNLLPLRVASPLERSIAEVAKDIQADIQMISAPDMVSSSLAEIYEWTGVRVNSFVNILKSSNPGIGSDTDTEQEGGAEWKAIQDLSSRAGVVDEVVNERLDVADDQRKCAAYLPSVDIELRLAADGTRIDMGVFAPVGMMGVEGAEGMIGKFVSFWE